MACDLRKVVNLPIKEEYKMALLEYFQKPENQAACQQFTSAPPEQIMALIQDMESKIKAPGAQNQGPGAGLPGQPPVHPQAGIGNIPPQGPASGQGIASIPTAPSRPQVPPGVAPGQLADTPMPMDVPRMPGRRY